jgi:rod shape-determining protein MreC
VPRETDPQTAISRQIKRLLAGFVMVVLLLTVVVWRIDSPRIERIRMQVLDWFAPASASLTAPLRGIVTIVQDFQSYESLQQQNRQLRRELRQMKIWKEAAVQLEQENARLRDLNKLRVDPKLIAITGDVLADSGSPFRQSLLVNVGARDGLRDGWAALDGVGLVGRIAGLGQETARVLLITDSSSQIPAVIQPSGQRALIVGDNSLAPPIEFLENPDLVRPGDRIVTSGDGTVFPPDLLIGELAQDPSGRLRVRLAADFQALEFLRILRYQPARDAPGASGLILPDVPQPKFTAPIMPELTQ